MAVITAGLGWGDEGKGSCVDLLCRVLPSTAVIRYNGGGQAAHNVVLPDGRHHTFSQFGSGTFIPGVITFLSRHVMVNPLTLELEEVHLFKKGVKDAYQRLYIDRRALLTTPFHRAANRLKEISRRGAKHGSCGMGIWETVEYWLNDPAQSPIMADLNDWKKLREKLVRLRDTKLKEVEALSLPSNQQVDEERSTLYDEQVFGYVLNKLVEISRRLNIVDGEKLLKAIFVGPYPPVFEGAQGVLLDQWAGFHPHTTGATTTFANAEEILREGGYNRPVTKLGLLRGYMTRHGAGPFPTETHLDFPLDKYNPHNDWQGTMRRGWLDLALLRYAVDCVGGVDALAVSCMDHLPEDCMVGVGHQVGATPLHLTPPELPDVEAQERMGTLLAGSTPIYEPVKKAGLVDMVSGYLRAPVTITSNGPTYQSKTILGSVVDFPRGGV